MSHTPGPWRYQKEITFSPGSPKRVRFEIYKSEGVYGHPATCDSEDDARLIAAAPELLEALEPFAKFACDEPHVNEPKCYNCIARDAVNKAKGTP